MCAQHDPVNASDNEQLQALFGLRLPEGEESVQAPPPPGAQPLVLPASLPPPGVVGALRWGHAGLLPPVAAEAARAGDTRVCRVEGMKSDPAFRESWWAGRRCIVPAQALSDWNYLGERPELCSIRRVDDQPLALAGLWAERPAADGQLRLSFCVLSVAGEGHELFGALSAPAQEKRMPVILPATAWLPWLHGSLQEAQRLLLRFPADQLRLSPRAPSFRTPREPRSWASVPDMFAHEWHVRAVEGPARRLPRTRRAPPAPGAAELALPTTGSLF